MKEEWRVLRVERKVNGGGKVVKEERNLLRILRNKGEWRRKEGYCDQEGWGMEEERKILRIGVEWRRK